MLLSTGIILSAFAGITYVLVNKLSQIPPTLKSPTRRTCTSHLGERASHLGGPIPPQGTHIPPRRTHIPPRERASHLGERASHLGEHKSHLGERASHLGERTSHLGERASHSEDTSHEKETLPWSYEGEHGPAHWGQFAPLALSGIRQSPIDLVVDRALNPRNLAPMSFHYQDSIMALKTPATPSRQTAIRPMALSLTVIFTTSCIFISTRAAST